MMMKLNLHMNFLYIVKTTKILNGVASRMKAQNLKENLAKWMISHGLINKHIVRSNAYTGVEIYELTWRRIEFRIVIVDGMTCVIEKM